jgi:hypothetical protein
MAEPNPKRLTLFKVYAENLALLKENGFLPNITPKYDRTYICPICLTHFSEEEALNTQAENYLSFEDVPPVSLGGKANILTCRKCNNTCGNEIDLHLTNRMKEWDEHKFVPGVEAHVKVELKGKTVQAEIKVEENGTMTVVNRMRRNNPQNLNEYIKAISGEDKPTVNLKFIPKKVDPERLQVALLKIGYLMAFQKFGYAFILDPMYDSLRRQLLSPDERIYPPKFWAQGPFPDHSLGTPVITEKGLESIAAIFDLKTKESRRFMVLIPITTRPIDEVLDNFQSRFDAEGNTVIEMTTIHDDNIRDIAAIKNFENWVAKIKT